MTHLVRPDPSFEKHWSRVKHIEHRSTYLLQDILVQQFSHIKICTFVYLTEVSAIACVAFQPKNQLLRAKCNQEEDKVGTKGPAAVLLLKSHFDF